MGNAAIEETYFFLEKHSFIRRRQQLPPRRTESQKGCGKKMLLLVPRKEGVGTIESAQKSTLNMSYILKKREGKGSSCPSDQGSKLAKKRKASATRSLTTNQGGKGRIWSALSFRKRTAARPAPRLGEKSSFGPENEEPQRGKVEASCSIRKKCALSTWRGEAFFQPWGKNDLPATPGKGIEKSRTSEKGVASFGRTKEAATST